MSSSTHASPPTPSQTDAPREESAGAPARAAHASSSVYPRVFYPAALVVAVFVAVALLAPTWLSEVLSAANTAVVNGIGWYYVLLVTGFVAFSLYAGFSRWGEIRLGRDDEEPQYGMASWFAMLFAAGMGIGLVFWGAAEPLNHLVAPAPGVDPNQGQSVAQSAMTTTFLHWGLHAWAIYVVVGLAIAYAVHRKGRPVSIRWALEPVLGDRVKGFWGDVVDVVAIVGTLFGVATSLGFGVTQISAGLDFLGLVEQSTPFMLILIVAITALATLSVVSGLDVGIKWLSNTNLVLAAVLMVALLVLGPSLFILREFVQSIGAYLQNFLGMSFRTLPYYGVDGETWLGSWTTYYWGWWISWSPFVGVFIARISRGRTVREFVLGVLLVPTLMTFLWFSVLGGSAIYRQLFGGGGLVGADGTVSTDTALFQLLETLPGAPVLIGLFILLLVIFFVTSADSGALVVAMLGSGGNPDPARWARILWSCLAGAIAAALLAVGAAEGALADGLTALQTMAIIVAAPFTLVMIAMCVSVGKSLHREVHRADRLRRAQFKEEVLDEIELEPASR